MHDLGKAPFDTIEEVISYFTSQNALCQDALIFFDKLYTSKYGVNQQELYDISRLEFNVVLKEVQILKIIQQENASSFDSYRDENYAMMTNGIFIAKSIPEYKRAIRQVQDLNNYFLNDQRVSTLVEDRNKMLGQIESLDKFAPSVDREAIRYKRIYLRRRALIFSLCQTQCTIYKKQFSESDVRKFKVLLDNEQDFSFEAFTAIFIGKSVPLLVDPAPDEIERLEVIDVERTLEKKDREFREQFIEAGEVKKSDFDLYVRETREREALRFIAEERLKALSYKNRIFHNKGEMSKKQLGKDIAIFMLSTVGKTLAKSLLNTIKGKADKAEWTQTAKTIGYAALGAVGFAVTKTLFAGIISPSVLTSIFSSFIPGPPDPVLQEIGEMRKQLDKIEEKIDGLSKQIEQFAKEITELINGLPEKVRNRLLQERIQEKIQDLKNYMQDTYKKCELIIKGTSVKEYSPEEFLVFNDKVIDQLRGILQLIYHAKFEMSPVAPGEYDVPDAPGSASLAYSIIDQARKSSSYQPVYETVGNLLTIYEAVCQDCFEYFNWTRSYVTKALNILYVTSYTGKNTDSQEAISHYLSQMINGEQTLKATLLAVGNTIRANMIGSGNLYLHQRLTSYAYSLKDFTFNSAFGLESDGKPVGIDESTRNLIVGDANGTYTRFFINPSFHETKQFMLAAFNNNGQPLFRDYKIALDFNGTITLMDAEFKQVSIANLKIVPLYEKEQMSRPAGHYAFDYLMAANESIEVGFEPKTLSLNMPLTNLIVYKRKDSDCYTRHIVSIYDERNKIEQYLFVGFETEPMFLNFNSEDLSFGLSKDQETMDHNAMICLSKMKRTNENTAFGSFAWHAEWLPGQHELYLDNRFPFAYIDQSRGQNKSKMFPGQKLTKGNEIRCAKGNYRIRLQEDGNLVLETVPGGKTEFWATHTPHQNIEIAIFTFDGHLMLYTANGDWKWYSGNSCLYTDLPFLEMQDDRNLVIYKNKTEPIWSSKTHRTDTLQYGEKLFQGQELNFTEGIFRTTLAFEGGNLTLRVRYNTSNSLLWESKTSAGAYATMGPDTYLDVCDYSGNVLARFGGYKSPNCFLVVKNQKLLLYNQKNQEVGRIYPKNRDDMNNQNAQENQENPQPNFIESCLGEIRMFAGNYAPQDWAFCDGKMLNVRDNQALFQVIGNAYGGDGVNTFALPDLRSRLPIGVGQGAGLTNVKRGGQIGSENTTLNAGNLPSFSGTGGGNAQLTGTITAKMKVKNATGSQPLPADSYVAGSDSGISSFETAADSGAYLKVDAIDVQHNLNVNMSSLTLAYVGTSNPLPVMQPCLGINFVICVYGYMPPRP